MTSKRLISLALITAGLAVLPGVRAQNSDMDLDPGALYDQGRVWFDQLAPEIIRNNFELPRREDWAQFWGQIERALQSGSLEDLAWLSPYVDNGLDVMKQIPATQPYADWLQQRADYFDMAGMVINVIPGPTPPQPPPVRPTPGKISVPARPAPTSAVPAQVVRGRQLYVQNRQSWDKKLKGRKVPSGAALAPRMKTIFAEEGVPSQWVWQAEVESSFNPQARSPVGAAGLYQFMPATAQRFGLKLEPQDERLIPEKSARAAAQYLKVLHKQFGSWPLTFAAYNAGEGRVARLLKKTAGPKTFEGIQNNLPLETQMYVPKIMAVVALREGIDPSKLPPPTYARDAYPCVIVTARLSM
jgi:membrane-bound lytic murein transglycosylase D